MLMGREGDASTLGVHRKARACEHVIIRVGQGGYLQNISRGECVNDYLGCVHVLLLLLLLHCLGRTTNNAHSSAAAAAARERCITNIMWVPNAMHGLQGDTMHRLG
jgi:hypothetical protein